MRRGEIRADRSDPAPVGARHRVGIGARQRTLVASAVTVLLWGSSFAGFRAGLTAYTPGHLVLLRFLLASTAPALYAGVTRMRLPARRDLPSLMVLGIVA
jgi:drug/metabolite transporter (DMT)-like permease